MPNSSNVPILDAVTGAFSYTGKYITACLVAQGTQVVNLTGHPQRPNPFGVAVVTKPLSFSRPDELVGSLTGVRSLYNTYWVRFSHGKVSFESAVENSRVLIQAAVQAGVKRIVHISISNPTLESPLPYFRGKAQVEQIIQASELSYAILRPTVVFGKEDILINNISYFLRRLPVFVLPGKSDFSLQPIYAQDLAELAVWAGSLSDNLILDAVGPEVYTFKGLVQMLTQQLNRRVLLLHLPLRVAHILTQVLSFWVQDVVLTWDEILGLNGNLLVSAQPPRGKTRLSEWVHENAQTLGKQYASELARHYR